MRILYLDLDTLRPDHLGCYGYQRNTSPNIDRIAARGVRFENYYATDAPCLPSRSALFSGRFGIHTGVVGHGGTAADPCIEGTGRGFGTAASRTAWPMMMRRAGYHTVSVSPFAERHSAWWFYTGFNEMINTGKGGMERADEIAPVALNWLQQNGQSDNWFLQVNFWDPHTPYRTPMEYGNPFEGEPIPDWLTQDMIDEHRASFGPHSAQEPIDMEQPTNYPYPRVPTTINNLDDFRRWIDGYDTGIRYMDDHIGQILDCLEAQGVLEDTAVIISSDHGENIGELNVYGDHQTADHICSRIPLIVSWPGMRQGAVDDGLHYNLDLPPTTVELLGGQSPAVWDGQSFAESLRAGTPTGRDYLVLSQCAWSCQRAVRFGPWVMIRTYHAGFKNYPSYMLFNIEDDPHETTNLAEQRSDIVNQAEAMLAEWHTDMMATSSQPVDPLWTVMHEGGPWHVRGLRERYAKRLCETGREHHVEKLP
ncbi:MAG: sulfatase family protein [Armatimonadota bacterium]